MFKRSKCFNYCSLIVWNPGCRVSPDISHHIFTCSLFPFRRYLNKSAEDQEEDLPGLEEDTFPEMDLTVLRRRTMAAAAERRMQNLQDPTP